jgi:thiosulfate reductase cytochrome b subunit
MDRAIHHSSMGFYTVAFVLPIVAVLICWIFYYAFNHHEPGRIESISLTVIQSPENRIFALMMNVEVVLLIPLYLARNKVMTLAAHRFQIGGASHWRKRLVATVCTVCVPVGLSILSALTLQEHQEVHLFGAFLFFWGSIVYYLVSDSCLRDVNIRVSVKSRVVSWLCLVFAITYTTLFRIANQVPKHQRVLANIGAVGQYLTALSIFVKIIMFHGDLPKHYLTVMPKEGD